ncbi:unnamed protein product [Ceutorhynchus assimilis]|uniref:Vitellogenin n=1 Tax=Ceutorhynchus assimilis TaxID=467358 RepID=A0A9N9MAY8_9CUCU|nr:unnamed protein product [Ceutorhynchus assimilis]
MDFKMGLAFASSHASWKDNTEYIYRVSGRSLTSLNELTDQYSGILLKAKLHVSTRPDGKLQARISDAQYAQIQSQLPDGWNSEISESQLNYKQLGLTDKPFKILTKEGVIKGLIVEKDVTNWEANVIKSIVSQLQLDIQGNNIIQSPINNLPKNNEMEGVFKSMEETVTGETETLYQIHRLPEYLTQSQPWLVPQQQLNFHGQIYEVIKSKNYSNTEDIPAYYYGFGEIIAGEPTGNRMGQFYTRQSSSRMILTGKVSKYTIQSSQTVDKIIINPTINARQQGSAISALNLTLSEVKSQSQQAQEMSNPVEIGNLVYTYERPFAKSNKVHEKMQGDNLSSESSEEGNESTWKKFRQSAEQMIKKMQQDDSSSSEETMQYQPRPSMTEAPQFPLLPYFMGYHGKSVRTDKDFDPKQIVEKIAREISEDVQQPEKILTQSTLSKYAMLCSLVRTMDKDDIKSLAEKLYTPDKQGAQRVAWAAFRDAVAEAGTGPAFLNIEEWISTKKVERQEAAEIISAMTRAVRVPTEEYMQSFFELIKKPEVRHQEYLNETAWLSFTEMVHKVYVNKHQSNNEYPVNSFRSFYTKEGKTFATSTVIPYLSQKLDEAVSGADSRKVHIFIRCLGNIGHKQILKAFEPYLEGQRQCSQFQRTLMVLSLDKLASSSPITARSVLYRIYQNAAEVSEVRVVAVYQLMRTNPSVEMLQHMAENTNTDQQEEVNAAVKSAIESACELTSGQAQSLRKSAESARPLLTRKEYGQQQSLNFLQDFVVENMNTEFKQNILQVGSPDSMLPKGLKYTLRGDINGFKHYFSNVQVMLSSVKELCNVLYRQTEQYQQRNAQRAQQQSTESKWSSAKIAESLDIQGEEREQLEGFIYTEIDAFQKIWSFDNETIEQLPEALRELEQQLKNGKQVRYNKLKQLKQIALSLPTETGFPFLYTYDIPMLVQYEGKVKAQVSPQISSGKKLRKPEQISAQLEGFVTISTKVQSHLSLVTPFDHQIYVAGFDKNFQVHLPLKINAEVNLAKSSSKIECELNEKHPGARLFHYSSWPYTSRSDIMTTSPVALRTNTHRLRPESDTHRSFDFVLGNKESGMAVRVSGHHPQQSINILQLADLIKSEGIVAAWQQSWDDATLQQTEADIRLAPEQSSSRKFTLRLGMQNQYKTQPQNQKQPEFLSIEQLSSKVECESQQRQNELLKHVSAGITNAKASCIDASLEFEGQRKNQYIFALAYAKSNVAPQSSLVAFYKSKTQTPREVGLQVKSYIPNTNGLDLTDSLEKEPKAKYEVVFQEKQERREPVEIKATIKMNRSESRKQALVEQPMYYVCKKEMQEGNKQLAACQNMTIESNFLNDIKIDIEYQNVPSECKMNIQRIYNAIRTTSYPIAESTGVRNQEDNKIEVRVQFQPEHLRQVNVTINKETKFSNISLGQWAKTLWVPHPVFHLKARLAGQMMGQDNIRPTCVIDRNAAQTFSNRTYPLSLGKGWTMMMLYMPEHARLDGERRVDPVQQLKEQQETFVVLIKETSEDLREMKIVFSHPTTEGKTVEINMKPTEQRSGAAVSVLVDGEEVHFNENKAADFFNGFMEIYSLNKGELKMEIRDWFYLIFDGERVKLTALNDKLRDSITGLCGRFSDDKYEDFQTPQNCIVRSMEKFVASYQVEGRQETQSPRECIRKELPLYTDVISKRDYEGRRSTEETSNKMELRNRYTEQNDDICFTIHPVPECKNGARKTVTKNVPVHCVSNSKTAYYLKSQIDQGGNPDFSHKSETKTIRMEIPQQCK